MKLRNKKTGEVIDAGCRTTLRGNSWITRLIGGGKPIYINFYESLAELNEEWEDYKPKTNSRFRLVKDLPTFKAGQEFHLSPKGNLILNDGKFGICAYAKQTLEKFPNILEDWFEPLDVEDINVTNMPLIKDEKIRKAVRAWAEANEETELKVTGGCLVTTFKGLHFQLETEFRCSWTRNGVYTIDELCGEVKELSNEK